MLLDPENSIYCRGIVVNSNIPDVTGETLSPVQIKSLLTRFNELKSDIDHSYEVENGIKVLENYIADSDGELGGYKYKKGSWLTVLKISSQRLINDIYEGNLNGLSLGSIGRTVNKGSASTNYYGDVNWSTLEPKYISLVYYPTNQLGMEIYSYNKYITKSLHCENGVCPVEFLNNIKDKRVSVDHVPEKPFKRVIYRKNIKKVKTPVINFSY
jgi:hypothetical protein